MVLFWEPETSNIGYLDPLGSVARFCWIRVAGVRISMAQAAEKNKRVPLRPLHSECTNNMVLYNTLCQTNMERETGLWKALLSSSKGFLVRFHVSLGECRLTGCIRSMVSSPFSEPGKMLGQGHVACSSGAAQGIGLDPRGRRVAFCSGPGTDEAASVRHVV